METCDRVFDLCEIFSHSGRPSRKNNSLSHVNEGFNSSAQSDFVIIYIRKGKYEVLNIIDAETNYGESSIRYAQNAKVMKELFETMWIYNHGAPDSFSADPEFTRPILVKFLESHGIRVDKKLSRSSWKNGKIERNNDVFKRLLEKISAEHTSASPQFLVRRASFMTNIFHGSSKLSSFQLVRGFSPSIYGNKASIVTEEMLTAHMQIAATRAL